MAIWLWIGFFCIVLALLALDLGVLNRKAHVVTMGEALAWTAFWVTLALSFNAGVYFLYEHNVLGIGGQGAGSATQGKQAALDFFTGYLVEKSLSLDNIFVIALIFTYFKVPLLYQHRTLFWGILGALVMRGAMIAAGAVLIKRFEWIVYVFGVFLIMTAAKMLIARHDNLEPGKNPVVRLARRFFAVTPDFEGEKFFSRVDGRRAVTPLFLALLMVESSDVLFAVDSIPAIFAITTDPFLVFTSNIFAILGLRSLYFALAALMEKFRYVRMSLVFLLAFIGVKMLLTHHLHISNAASLAVIAGILSVGLLASFMGTGRDPAPLISPLGNNVEYLIWHSYKNARRVGILVIGSSVLLVGIAMIVLPGPAFVVIPLGLAILATEFIWARKLLNKVKEKMSLNNIK
ncbi:MAG: TerC/Alx family metal homeostasis membrane protein [Nitrospinae bacterium]|nr:TerC/Alx family metal homeostasis membrane protein [Nitrospinota bacterium]